MFVFQVSNEDKTGIIVSMKPNEFTPAEAPDKVDIITFNKNSEQAKTIEAAETTLASARKEVLAEINTRSPAEREKANTALEKFDKAVKAYNIGSMNHIQSNGKIIITEETIKKLETATFELSEAMGYRGATADPVEGINIVGKLRDASREHANTVMLACASVTVMDSDMGRSANRDKLAARKEAGSEKISYERLPKAVTSEATGLAQPINYKIAGTLNSSELENVQRNYKPVQQQVAQSQDNRKVGVGV